MAGGPDSMAYDSAGVGEMPKDGQSGAPFARPGGNNTDPDVRSGMARHEVAIPDSPRNAPRGTPPSAGGPVTWARDGGSQGV